MISLKNTKFALPQKLRFLKNRFSVEDLIPKMFVNGLTVKNPVIGLFLLIRSLSRTND